MCVCMCINECLSWILSLFSLLTPAFLLLQTRLFPESLWEFLDLRYCPNRSLLFQGAGLPPTSVIAPF